MNHRWQKLPRKLTLKGRFDFDYEIMSRVLKIPDEKLRNILMQCFVNVCVFIPVNRFQVFKLQRE